MKSRLNNVDSLHTIKHPNGPRERIPQHHLEMHLKASNDQQVTDRIMR